MSKAKQPSGSEYDAELNFHLEKLIEEKLAAGYTPDRARREAILALGRGTQLKEELRDVFRSGLLERLLVHLRLAMRLMRKSPGFSLAIVATLALGIGANSSVFSAINAILLRPLPFPEGDQLIKLWQYEPKSRNPQSFVAPVRLEDWSRLNTTCQAISGWYLNESSETSGALPERVQQALIAPRFLQVWGVQPALGRDFKPEELHFGGPRAVLISDRYWRRKFQADPHAVGRLLRVEGGSTTVVGVMPASFRFPERDVDLWTISPPDAPYAQPRSNTWFTTVARMKPGVTLAQAQSDLNRVQKDLGRAFPQTDSQLAVHAISLKEENVGSSRRTLGLLFASVSLLLLLACTNIAALLLARTTQRQREIAVRFSLGASRASIVFQLMTEAFVLALAGAAAGLAIAWGATLFLRNLTKTLPRAEEVSLDSRLVLYTLACAVATTLLCGTVPALIGTRRTLAGELAHSGKAQVSQRAPWQWTLVAMQVALAVILLSSAGLLLRTFAQLAHTPLGYDPTHVLTLRISGNWGETTDFKKLNARIDAELNTLRAAPGVESAATAGSLPGVPGNLRTEYRIPDSAASADRKLTVDSRTVSDGYFEALRIPLLSGAPCQPNPGFTALVNRSFADRYLSGENPVGHHVQLVSTQFPTEPFLIRGMVADAREQSARNEPYPTIYWCANAPYPTPYFLVRTLGDPMALAQTLRQRLSAADPARSVFDISTLEDHISETQAERRLGTTLLSLFALTAIALAAVGLYGTLSYLVTVRRREVALRLALGARQRQILARFLRQGLSAAAIGYAVGLLFALIATQSLASLLYGITYTDPATYAAVLLLVLVVAAIASFTPSLRAARVEPMTALRDE